MVWLIYAAIIVPWVLLAFLIVWSADSETSPTVRWITRAVALGTLAGVVVLVAGLKIMLGDA